jgi:thioredoxin-dependent peroxiredoxin
MDSTVSHYPEEGEFAPDFSFRTANGRSMKLSGYQGNRCIILYFYPKDFTPGCTTEAKEFSTDNEKFESKGITILGVSPDETESHVKFKERMNIPYELISDPDHRIASLYGSYGPKNFMGKEYLGVQRSTFLIGKDGRIIKIFHRVKPLGHSEQVMKEFKNSC